MNSGKKVTILDVRTPAEYHEGCVKGFVNIPLCLPNNFRNSKFATAVSIMLCIGYEKCKSYSIFNATRYTM